jgi:RHS repeat-associated protein
MQLLRPQVGVSYNLRFPGQYYMAETGLMYNYARDYDPQTGRFIESDPLGLAAGVNPYAYVLCPALNPTTALEGRREPALFTPAAVGCDTPA